MLQHIGQVEFSPVHIVPADNGSSGVLYVPNSGSGSGSDDLMDMYSSNMAVYYSLCQYDVIIDFGMDNGSIGVVLDSDEKYVSTRADGVPGEVKILCIEVPDNSGFDLEHVQHDSSFDTSEADIYSTSHNDLSHNWDGNRDCQVN